MACVFRSSFWSLLLLVWLARCSTSEESFLQHDHHHHGDDGVGDCGMDEDATESTEDAKLYRQALESYRAARREPFDTIYRIPVYFHIIRPDDRMEDYYTDSLIRLYMSNIHTYFANTPFQFLYVNISRTNNSTWHLDYTTQQPIKTILRVGGPESLNVYFFDTRSRARGFAWFPWNGADVWQDGVNINSEFSSPILFPQFLVPHEIGHWLGLYHTFQNGCDDEVGDGVDDTPQHLGNSGDCTQPRDSCPDLPGLDPTNNTMSYSSDRCRDAWTDGQIERMIVMFETYRYVSPPDTSGCSDGYRCRGFFRWLRSFFRGWEYQMHYVNYLDGECRSMCVHESQLSARQSEFYECGGCPAS